MNSLSLEDGLQVNPPQIYGAAAADPAPAQPTTIRLSELIKDELLDMSISQSRGLSFVEIILRGTSQGLRGLKRNDPLVDIFDAAVKEARCQVRASAIMELANQLLVDKEFENEVDEFIALADRSIEDIQKLKTTKKFPKGTLREHFVHESQLNLTFTQHIAFIIQTHLLTIAKVGSEAHHAPLRDLCKILNCPPKEHLKTFAEHLRYILAKASVGYVREVVDRLGVEKGDDTMQKMVSMNVLLNAGLSTPEGRLVTPFFYSVKPLLYNIRKNQGLVMFVIERKSGDRVVDTIRRLCSFDKEVDPTEMARIDPKKAVMVFKGESTSADMPKEEFEKQFFSRDQMEIILANAAAHYQYYSTELDGDSLNTKRHAAFQAAEKEAVGDAAQKELDSYRFYAIKEGCSIADKRLFCIDHVYAERVGIEMGRKE